MVVDQWQRLKKINDQVLISKGSKRACIEPLLRGSDFQGLGPTGYAKVGDLCNSLTAVLRSSSGTLKGAAASCVYNNDWAIAVFGEPETPLADNITGVYPM